MGTMPIQTRGISTSRMLYGCMGLGGGWNRNPITSEDVQLAEACMEAALASGISYFDHADIYTYGKAESVFGQVLANRPGLRDKMILQSKCGIHLPDGVTETQYYYESTKSHVLKSVDGILARLGIDTLDVLLIHRPDALMEVDEIGEAFQKLHRDGKVRHFGVSNMHAGQIQLLEKGTGLPMVVNQIEMSLSHRDWLDVGVHVNHDPGHALQFPSGLIEFTQIHDIQLQAYSPLSRGLYTSKLTGSEPDHVRETALLVKQLAEEYGVFPESVVLGWLMRHPANIQPIIGTATPARIRACADATKVATAMTREQWYLLYERARGVRLP